MAIRTFNIDSFPKGYYMSWFVTTQATFLVKVKLFDDSKVYFEKEKQSPDINPPLAEGADTIAGNNLKITIEEPESKELKSSIISYNIPTADTASIVGHGYNIFIEDKDDNDYNDVSISLIAWKTKG